MPPWVMQSCHSTASCHLGTARTLRCSNVYWWTGMSICTRGWLRHCLKRQARKTSRLMVHWPIISMPQPEEPGIAVSADYFGPFPVTPRGSTYILLFTDRFGRRAEMYAVTAAELQLAFASTGIFTSGDARTAYSWTTASSLAQSFRMPSTSFLGVGKLPPAKWQWWGGAY